MSVAVPDICAVCGEALKEGQCPACRARGTMTDALTFGGLLLLAAGAGVIYWPASLLVLGAGAMGIGVFSAYGSVRK